MIYNTNPAVFPNLIRLHEQFESAKGYLLNRWIDNQHVSATLSKYHIAPEFFSRYFGSKILNYSIGMMRGEHEYGSCPIISVMLVFFQKKKFALEDIIILCSNLKNTMLQYMLEDRILTNESLSEITELMGNNLRGVIRDYLDMHYRCDVEGPNCSIDILADEINTYETAVNSSENINSSYCYLQEVSIDSELLDELNEIETEAIASLDITKTINQTTYDDVLALFSKYIKVLNQLVEFKEIAYALRMLIDLLQHTDLESTSKIERSFIVIYFKAIASDLALWHKSVFIDQNAEDIHYLDQSLLSSITQMEIMLSKHSNPFIHDIEFF